VWQDRRTAGFCDNLKNEGYGKTILDRTGLIIDAYFSATKVRWILDNVKDARELAGKGRLAFGTVDTWLIWNLTQGRLHVTDVSNASRTMLFNIHTLSWDKELLAIFDIPGSMLPEVRSSSDIYGVTSGQFASEIPCRYSRRPAGSTFRTDVHWNQDGKEHLWHRLLYDDEHWESNH
jgi:glycerol kinase